MLVSPWYRVCPLFFFYSMGSWELNAWYLGSMESTLTKTLSFNKLGSREPPALHGLVYSRLGSVILLSLRWDLFLVSTRITPSTMCVLNVIHVQDTGPPSWRLKFSVESGSRYKVSWSPHCFVCFLFVASNLYNLKNPILVAIIAGKFHDLSKPAFIVLFALLQFFFNFGANTCVIFLFNLNLN